jgi:hypothetical protein
MRWLGEAQISGESASTCSRSELYDVVVIPSTAAASPDDPAYPPMPD